MTDLPRNTTALTWRKSSRSGSNGGNCVEVAFASGNTVALRDSKNPHGPVLSFADHGWRAFHAATRTGRFTRN